MQFLRRCLLLLSGLFMLPYLSQAAPIEVVLIPDGAFSMGSDSDAGIEKPVRTVHIRSFRMMKYEVTQAQWTAVMGDNPSKFKSDDSPVEEVSWLDIQGFIEQLNHKTGKRYRLPSEAEWEYAARAGSQSDFNWNHDASAAYKYAWYKDNSDNITHSVGRKLPNSYGLHDMYGNVWEWVEDCWNKSYINAPSNGSAWKTGDCSQHVLRGGSWSSPPRKLRSSYRIRDASGKRHDYGGFRLAHD